jgi:hypothetical protein
MAFKTFYKKKEMIEILLFSVPRDRPHPMIKITPIYGADSSSTTIKLAFISLLAMPLSPSTVDHNSPCKIKPLFNYLRIRRRSGTLSRISVLLAAAPLSLFAFSFSISLPPVGRPFPMPAPLPFGHQGIPDPGFHFQLFPSIHYKTEFSVWKPTPTTISSSSPSDPQIMIPSRDL